MTILHNFRPYLIQKLLIWKTRLENHLVKMNDCEAEQTIRALKTMKDDLVSGVTTARCLGDRFYIDVTCKQAQKEGRIVGPKLVVSGIGMRASHGHGYVGMPHNGPEEFRKTARDLIDFPHSIKNKPKEM